MDRGSLTLYRRANESIIIDVDGRLVEVLIADVQHNRAKVIVKAEKDIKIDRREIYEEKRGLR